MIRLTTMLTVSADSHPNLVSQDVSYKMVDLGDYDDIEKSLRGTYTYIFLLRMFHLFGTIEEYNSLQDNDSYKVNKSCINGIKKASVNKDKSIKCIDKELSGFHLRIYAKSV